MPPCIGWCHILAPTMGVPPGWPPLCAVYTVPTNQCVAYQHHTCTHVIVCQWSADDICAVVGYTTFCDVRSAPRLTRRRSAAGTLGRTWRVQRGRPFCESRKAAGNSGKPKAFRASPKVAFKKRNFGTRKCGKYKVLCQSSHSFDTRHALVHREV